MALVTKVIYKLTRLEPPDTPTEEYIPVKFLTSYEGSKVSLGRGRGQCPENAIYCRSDARHVSRQHCYLEFRNGDWFIADVQSSNGTFVNAEQLVSGSDNQPNFRKLEGGDRIGLGVRSFDRRENDSCEFPLTEFYIFLFEKIIIKGEGGENCCSNSVPHPLNINLPASNEVASDPDTEPSSPVPVLEQASQSNSRINNEESSKTDDSCLGHGSAETDEDDVGDMDCEEDQEEENATKSTVAKRKEKASTRGSETAARSKSQAGSSRSDVSKSNTSAMKERGSNRKKTFVVDSSSDSDDDSSRNSKKCRSGKPDVNAKNPQVSLCKSRSPNQIKATRNRDTTRRKTNNLGSDTESSEDRNERLKQKGRRQRSTSSNASEISSKMSDRRGKKADPISNKKDGANSRSSTQNSRVRAKKRRDTSSSSSSTGSDKKSELASKKRKSKPDSESESENDSVFDFRASAGKKSSSPNKKLRLSEDLDDFIVPDDVVEYEGSRKRKSKQDKSKVGRHQTQQGVKLKSRNSSIEDESDGSSDFKAKLKTSKSCSTKGTRFSRKDDETNHITKKNEKAKNIQRKETRKDLGHMDRGIVHQPQGRKTQTTLDSSAQSSVGELKPWKLKQKEQELINRQPFIQIKQMFCCKEDGKKSSLDWKPSFVKKYSFSVKELSRIEKQFISFRQKHKGSSKHKGIIAKKYKARRPEFRFERGRIRVISACSSSDSEGSTESSRKSHSSNSSSKHHSVHQISSSEVSDVPNDGDAEPEVSDAQAVSPDVSAGEESDKDSKRDDENGRSPDVPVNTPKKPRQAICIDPMPVNPRVCRRRLLTGGPGPSSMKFKPSVSPTKPSGFVDFKEQRRQKLKDIALKNKPQNAKPVERDVIHLTTAKARVTANTRQDDLIRSMLNH